MGQNARKKRQRTVLSKLGSFFIQQGKILSKEEYSKSKEQPIAGSSLRKYFRSYEILVRALQEDESLMALIAQSASIQEAKRAPKPVAKAALKTAFKPAPKVASKTEK